MSTERKEVHIFKSTGQMVKFAAEMWVKVAKSSLSGKGYFSAALSGGTTPIPLYRKLSEVKNLPWDKTHVFIVDERFVPYESEENNYHMINRELLRHVAVPPRNIHPIFTSEVTPASSAERYEQNLLSYCKKVRTKSPRFDLLVLGIGEDGHTASLMPGTPCLKENKHWAVHVSPSNRIKRARITITLPVINLAEHIIFLVTGANKAKTVKKIIENQSCNYPAALVKPENGKVYYLLDKAAGSELSSAN